MLCYGDHLALRAIVQVRSLEVGERRARARLLGAGRQWRVQLEGLLAATQPEGDQRQRIDDALLHCNNT